MRSGRSRSEAESKPTVAYCDALSAISASVAGAVYLGGRSVSLSATSQEIPIEVVEPEEAQPPCPTPPPLPAQVKGADRDALQRALGEFRLVKQIGEGAMGWVYLAEHHVIGSKVAIKFLKPSFAANPQVVEQFHDEARAVNRVGHPGILKIFDLRFAPPSCYMLVMEHIEGRPLSALCGRPVPAKVAVPILAQICDALHAAHQVGVVHRDIKPENVFLVRRERGESVKLLDFGAARLHQGDEGQPPGGHRRLVLGTPAYMPPEQWRNVGVDARSDVYGVGVLAYVLATGRKPFQGNDGSMKELFRAHRDLQPEDPRSLNPHVSKAWAEVILKAIAKQQEDRFGSAAELAAALRRLLVRRAEGPRRARRPSPEPSLTPTYSTVWSTGGSSVLGEADGPAARSTDSVMVLDGALWASSFRACASATVSSTG